MFAAWPEAHRSQGAPAIDAEAFRDVIGRFATGVTIITARWDGANCGMTASAVSSLSLEPPMLLICVNRANATHAAITESGAFAVNVLDEAQAEVAATFASRSDDKFAGLAVIEGIMEQPMLSDALAVLECSVSEHFIGGTHEVFVGRVISARAREGGPLTYYRGRFGRFGDADETAVYDDLRERVLARDFPLDTAISLETAADDLGVTEVQVGHALRRLVSEGLITRDAQRGYFVTPIDVAAVEHAFDARCALELAVAEMCVGSVSSSQLAVVRERMEGTAPWISEGRITNLKAYVEADDAFHRSLIALARNPLLDRFYRRLGVEAIMLCLKRHRLDASEQLIDDHRAIVNAVEAGDIEFARSAIRSHTMRAKQIGSQAIRALGGRV